MHFVMNKSKAAFLLSAQRLFAEFPHSMYFWTFTFEDVYADWWYPEIWRKFSYEVNHLYGGYVCGLRVIEPHEQHGLHYHLLVNRRLSVHLIRRIGKKYGMGRIDVERCNYGAALYLSKYLAKRTHKMFGVRRWHTFGAYRGVAVNSIEIDSSYMRARREVLVKEKVPIGYERLLEGSFRLHGKAGLRKCYDFLRQGKTMSACMMVNPNVELTPKGGLRYCKRFICVPVKSVKSN